MARLPFLLNPGPGFAIDGLSKPDRIGDGISAQSALILECCGSRIREVALLPDPQDVEILRSGPRAWNAWRENNPSTVPDLTGIALSLSERQMGPINGGPINLKSARLQGAMLRFATLSAADLEAADMSDADLVHARLDRANLSAANLSNALLDHADFAGATLTKVNLCGASLQHAILSDR